MWNQIVCTSTTSQIAYTRKVSFHGSLAGTTYYILSLAEISTCVQKNYPPRKEKQRNRMALLETSISVCSEALSAHMSVFSTIFVFSTETNIHLRHPLCFHVGLTLRFLVKSAEVSIAFSRDLCWEIIFDIFEYPLYIHANPKLGNDFKYKLIVTSLLKHSHDINDTISYGMKICYLLVNIVFQKILSIWDKCLLSSQDSIRV